MGALPEIFSRAVNVEGLHLDVLLSSDMPARGRANPYHDKQGKFTSKDSAVDSGTGEKAAKSGKAQSGTSVGKRPGATKSGKKSVGKSGAAPFRLGRIFSKREMSLPENSTNAVKTKDALYAAARPALADFDASMDHGQGVDRALGGTAVRPTGGDDFLEALRRPGTPAVIIAPLKGERRAEEKVRSKYGGDWSRLTDVVRGTVAVDKARDIEGAVKAIHQELGKRGFSLAMRPEDRISHPAEGGYRDAVVKYRSKQGVIAEVLISTKAMILAKQGDGHRLYEEARSTMAKAALEGRDLTPAEAQRVNQLTAQQAEIYGAAWRESGGAS